ncbi:histone-like nucleoid-structuring protein Lsr2 [Jatrophihabitans fulvus]
MSLIDDLDGGKADRTISFAFEGAHYEIELSKKNAAALEKALKPYIEVARRSAGSKRPSRPRGRSRAASGAASSRKDLAAIREWAAANGIEVSTRGRIAQSVLDAYAAAH